MEYPVLAKPEIEILSPERGRLEIINKYGLAGRQPCEGILPLRLVTESKKNLLSAIEGLVKEGPQGLIILKPRIEWPFNHFSQGDVILDLDTGRTIKITDEIPTFRVNETQGNMILIKNGEAMENITLLQEKGGLYQETRPISSGRIDNFEIGAFFRRASWVGKKETMIVSIDVALFGETSGNTRSLNPSADEFEETLDKQALIIVTTKDGQLLFPETTFLGDLVITDPRKLAIYIFDKKIYNHSDQLGDGMEKGRISFREICWLIIHSAIQRTVSEYTANKLLESPHSGIIKEERQQEILAEIGRALEEVGITREPAKTDIRRWEQVSGGPEGGEFKGETVSIDKNQAFMKALLAEHIAEQLRKRTDNPHINQGQILALNPDLSSSEGVDVPPTIKLLSFATLVDSIYWYPEIPAEERSESFRLWVEKSAQRGTFNTETEIRSWMKYTLELIEAHTFAELDQKGMAKLIAEGLPDVCQWLTRLVERRKELRLPTN